MGHDVNDPVAVAREEVRKAEAVRRLAERRTAARREAEYKKQSEGKTSIHLVSNQGVESHVNSAGVLQTTKVGSETLQPSHLADQHGADTSRTFPTSRDTASTQNKEPSLSQYPEIPARFPPGRFSDNFLPSRSVSRDEHKDTVIPAKRPLSSSSQEDSLFVPDIRRTSDFHQTNHSHGSGSRSDADKIDGASPFNNSAGRDSFEIRPRGQASVYSDRTPGYAQPRIHPSSSLSAYPSSVSGFPPKSSLDLSKKDSSGRDHSVGMPTSEPRARSAVWSDPDWCKGPTKPKKRSQVVNRNALDGLTNLKDTMYKLDKHGFSAKGLDDIRTHLHRMEHMEVNEELVRQSKLLLAQHGLPRLFADRFPQDIRGDARALANKWLMRDFDPDILRGIKQNRGAGGRYVASLDSEWLGHDRRKANEFGTGYLANGQWWPTQLTALRDGAHGSTEGGISGIKGKGAVSIVISGSHYEDQDEGESLWYCGTEGKDGQISDNTRLLMLNKSTGNPVRVLRSHNLPKENPYRPAAGFRYDGTYRVVESELLSKEKAHHRFLLVREDGQDAIRHVGSNKRPTDADVAAYNKHRALISKS
ncbi:MAG: hypothetical protein M1828_001715 [Chrysothrix sp. TS-e1954]|nr:MAG: hypothetical protein M1828_001715 [Chrysothrix sp. TS-e1954]